MLVAAVVAKYSSVEGPKTSQMTMIQCVTALDIKANVILFQEQSLMLWSIRDNLSGHVSNDALRGLLEYNNQEVVSGGTKVSSGETKVSSGGAMMSSGGAMMSSGDTRKSVITHLHQICIEIADPVS